MSDIYEVELQRLAATFESLIKIQTPKIVDYIEGEPMEYYTTGLQTLVDYTEPQHREVNEALQEYRTITNDWKKSIRNQSKRAAGNPKSATGESARKVEGG